MNWIIFFKILIVLEGTGGDPTIVGDQHLQNKAYGLFQIRKPYVEDVNNFYRDEVLKKFGRLQTAKDMQDTDTATWYVKHYLNRWSSVFERKNGRKPEWYELARIHNGGPNGYKQRSTYLYLKRYFRVKDWMLR